MSIRKAICPACGFTYEMLVSKHCKRSLEQNSKLHPMVTDISKQIMWDGKYRSVEDWKDILTAAYKIAAHELEIVPCPDSDKLIILGLHTSQMSVSEMSDLITYIYAFGNGRGVVWSKHSKMEDL